MKNNIRVALFPIDNYDRRRDVEFIENNGYTIHELETAFGNDVLFYTLSNFQELCNDQEFDIENYWVTYVRLIDDVNEHNRNISTLIKSCEEGRDGDWDVETDEGKEGFNDMIELLNRCYLK